MSNLRDIAIDILERLDVKAEYASLGVKFLPSSRVRDNGYIECFAFDREEKRPSAAICVKGKSIGRYVDKAGQGLNLSFFDFCAKFFPSRFPTWQAARKHYAAETGVKISGQPKAADRGSDKLKFLDQAKMRHALRIWAKKKGGISLQACLDFGARLALWPATAFAASQSVVIAFPVFKPNSDKPCGQVIVNSSGGDLRLYRGKDNPATFEKVLSVGGSESGMLGLYGCKRIVDAKYVWLVEGLSDGLSVQTIIPPDLQGIHVVIANSAGATEHPKPEWIAALKGKIVFLCRDCDIPGRAGAERWGGALANVATVHDVQLPYPIVEKHGPDVRDYIMEGATWETLFKLAASGPKFEPKAIELEPTKPSMDASVLEDKLKIIILGEHEDGSIEGYSQHYGKLFKIPNVQVLGMPLLLQCVGEPAQRNVTDSRGETPPGALTLNMVRNMIAMEAGKHRLTTHISLGAGCWRIGGSDDIAIVDNGKAAIWNGKSLRALDTPRVGPHVLDFAPGDPWCDFDLLGKILHSMNHEVAAEAVDDLASICSQWIWRHKADADVVAAAVACTWVQTLWRWRPMISVSGGSDSGKTTFFDSLLQESLGGSKFVLFAQKPTEAGVRQHVRNTAMPLLLDEFESSVHRGAVMELIRTSSRGGTVFRGTSSQRGKSFGLKHIVWMAAIETGLTREPDSNRFIRLELKRPAKKMRGKLVIPPHSDMRMLGFKLLAAGLRYIDDAIKIADAIRSTQIPNVPGRVVESYSVPAAMLAAIRGKDAAHGEEYLRFFLEGRFDDQSIELDEDELVREIVHSQIHVGGGTVLTPSEIIADPGKRVRYLPELERHGISLVLCRRGPRIYDAEPDMVFLSPPAIQRFLLKGTRWSENVDASSVLLRIDGARRDQCQIRGRRVRGIVIPYGKVVSMSATPDKQPTLDMEHE